MTKSLIFCVAFGVLLTAVAGAQDGAQTAQDGAQTGQDGTQTGQDGTQTGQDAIDYREDQWGTYLNPEPGHELKARANIELFETLPSGILVRRSTQASFAKPGTTFEVRETATIGSLFGDHHFVKVRPTSPTNQDPCASGCWAYQGREGADAPENFLPSAFVPRGQLGE